MTTNAPYNLIKSRPVNNFDMEYQWQTGIWEQLFDQQVKLIRSDIQRAYAEGKIIIYLSCPISGRGGGYSATNVDIAHHTEKRLLMNWGEQFWILNPVRYQMESKEGTGLLQRHLETLNLDESLLETLPKPLGGDYMRMWTKVLVEDQQNNSGGYFDGFYFLGPKDVQAFFKQGGATNTTAGIEEYFARKLTTSEEFQQSFSIGDDIAQRKADFFRFYAVKASAAFSLGCHDEWNIFVKLNRKRMQSANDQSNIPELLAGYYDGEQLSLDRQEIVKGYEQSQ